MNTYPDEDYELDEPVASCEVCGASIYDGPFDDDGTDLCDQCRWWREQTSED